MSGGEYRVCYVEDLGRVRRRTGSNLREAIDGTVVFASDADAALDQVDDVDCVVSGHTRGGLDVLDLLTRVRDCRPDLPVIVYTADGSEELASAAISAGVTDYIRRDVTPAEVVARRVAHAVDRYRTERALRESEERYRTLVERSHDGIYIYRGQRFQLVNDRLCELMGRSREELMETDIWELLHPDDRERVHGYGKQRANGEDAPTRYEARIVRPSGEVRHCEFSVQMVTHEGKMAGLGSVRDVTEQRRAKRRFRALIENSPSMITILDPDGNIEYASPSVANEFGYSRETLEGTDVFELIHPADREAVSARFADILTEPDATTSASFRFQGADGDWHVLEAVGRNCLSDSAIEGIVVNTRDVTERRRREEALQRQNERLDEFASVVSHDLRNPINIISGHVELARETGGERHFEAIENAADRMATLVDSLLTLAREGQETGHLQTVELRTVAKRAWRTVETDDATLSVAPALGPVRADAERLRALFENVFRNSVEHGSTGCRTQSSDDASLTVRVQAVPGGFAIEDDGPGIDPAVREHVFERGVTTSETGTGYGLSIVKRVAEAHGWETTVTESAEGGARFEFTNVDAVSELQQP
ncbi:PAS domain S-box protein [Natronomonas sp. EA1]|uniref:PAS domain S-box protein n=1 Tax=Natronomonas sp. EA1 TaxID=3421655 RepID=UPI003EC045F6